MTGDSVDSGAGAPNPVTEPPADPTRAPRSGRDGDTDGPIATGGSGPSSPLSAATARIRRDPALLLPFVVAGALLAVVDWARRRDPLPTLPLDDGDGVSISVELVGYPTGAPGTARSLESLVDLHLPYLAWGIGLELAALLVVAVAGAVTIARALEVGDQRDTWRKRVTGRRLVAYLGLVVLFDAAERLLGSLGDVGLVLGIPLLVVVCVVLVRLFVAPAFVVAGSGPIAALRRSDRVTRGIGWSIFALVLGFGLATWLLTLVPLPYAGPLLSSALVASIHAVTVAVLWERIDGAEPGSV